MDKELVERLTENGMEVEKTLERFMGNEELYIKFLKKFLEDGNCAGLKEAVEQGDRDNAFLSAHTLKGLAANLGLNCILEPLVPIVETLRNGSVDNLADNIKKLDENYLKVTQIIESL